MSNTLATTLATKKLESAKQALGHRGQVVTSVMSGLLFFIVANPWTFKVVDQLIGRWIPVADANGCPTLAGLMIHSVVYGLLVYLLMRLGSKPAA